MQEVIGRAFARAGLLGNPSDLYGGKAIALTVCDFAARARIGPGPRLELGEGADALVFPSWVEACAAPADPEAARGAGLVHAALRRFARGAGLIETPPPADRARPCIRWESDVPRQVGLAGSSAIVIAVLRGLAAWFGRALLPDTLAQLALAAEVEELGIVAGPMDRVVQAHEGVLHMDFGAPAAGALATTTRIDPSLLPPLGVAWDPRGGQPSGTTHAGVRQRWLRGDPAVRTAMALLPRLVDEGMACLAARDGAGLRRLVDRNLDVRASVFELGAADLEMVRIGRGRGAGVKLCGSGGAVLFVPRDAAELPSLERAYDEAGYRTLRPRFVPPGRCAA